MLIALGALLVVSAAVLGAHLAHYRHPLWTYVPPEPGLVHFAVEGEILCAAWDTGRVAALDLATGLERPGSEIRRAFPFLGEPLLVSGKALVGSEDGRLRCLDLALGRPLWECRTGGAVRGRPLLAGDRVIFGSDDGFVYCVRFGDGTLLWRAYCGGAIGAEVALTQDRVVTGTADNGIQCVSAASEEPEAQRWRWGLVAGAPVLSPAVAYTEGKVVVGSDEGAVYLLEADSGRVLHRRPTPGLVRLRPAVLGDTLVIADSSGQVLALDFEGRVRWSRQLGDLPSAGLVAGRTAVYLATYGQEALALQVSDGAVLWDRGLPAPAGGSLALSDRLVLIGLVDGRICAFPRPAGD